MTQAVLKRFETKPCLICGKLKSWEAARCWDCNELRLLRRKRLGLVGLPT